MHRDKKKKKQCTLLVDKKNYALLIFFKRGICPSLWSSQQEVSNVIETNLCIYELKLKILRVSMNWIKVKWKIKNDHVPLTKLFLSQRNFLTWKPNIYFIFICKKMFRSSISSILLQSPFWCGPILFSFFSFSSSFKCLKLWNKFFLNYLCSFYLLSFCLIW